MTAAVAAETVREPTRRVTITDVSEALGLAKSTVSRALNGYPDIAESTRARISAKARDMGYVPLSQAQGIKTGRTRSLGLVIQLADHDSHRPFLAEFLAGLSHAASVEGWTLTVATSESEGETLAKMEALLRDRKADGFILPRTMLQDPRIELLRRRDVPFVLFGRTGDPAGCAWFDILGEEAMRDAVVWLAGLGHRRIGFVNGGTRYTYSALRHDGYVDGLREAGIGFDPALVLQDALTPADGAAAARRLLALPEPPTAVLYAIDAVALGLYRVAREVGLSVGRDISVMAYDGTPDGIAADPPLTTFVVDFRNAGERLAAMLIRRVRGEAPEALRETAQARFLDRGSAGPPALTPAQLKTAIGAERPARNTEPNGGRPT